MWHCGQRASIFNLFRRDGSILISVVSVGVGFTSEERLTTLGSLGAVVARGLPNRTFGGYWQLLFEPAEFGSSTVQTPEQQSSAAPLQ